MRRPYMRYGKRDLDWCALFIECELLRSNGDSHAITTIANRERIVSQTFRNKYNIWIKAGRPSAQQGDVGSGCNSSRGGRNRGFTYEQEY